MEELFRFSVIRPANRSVAATAPLVRGRVGKQTKLTGPDLQTSLTQLATQLLSDNPPALTVWSRFEPVALAWIEANGQAQVSNTLWNQLGSFSQALETMVDGWDANSTVQDLNSAFAAAPKPSVELTIYRGNLADLFLALLIVRRSGPVGVDAIIRAGKLWVLADLLHGNPTLTEIADRVRALDLIAAGALAIAPNAAADADAAAIEVKASYGAVANSTLLLPPLIFASLRKPIHGVGFREFHVVKQHIRRYNMAEVGRIENILKGESRSHALNHTLSNETDTFFQTDTTTETDKELSSNDQVDIKSEADDQVKTDTKIDGGVHASYDGGSYKLSADLTASYDKSTDSTNKFSSDVAKQVTQKASTKVTTRVTQSQATKVIETFADQERQRFNNTKGDANISGVYQWVEKVYLSQVFNLGRHMLLDIMVPEPAANLLGLASTPPVIPSQAVPPLPMQWLSLPGDPSKTPRPVELSDNLALLQQQGWVLHDLTPADLQPDEINNPAHATGLGYMPWLGRYGVTGVAASPSLYASAGKSIARNATDGDFAAEDEIDLPDDYEAMTAHVQIGWKHSKGDDETGITTVQLGASSVVATEGTPQSAGVLKAVQPSSNAGDSSQNSYFVDHAVFLDLSADTKDAAGNPSPIVGAIPIGVSAPNIGQVSVTVEISCRRLPSALRTWQLQVFEKIVIAYRQLQSDYASKTAGTAFAPAVTGTFGAADETTNRATERLELKRSCIAIIDNDNVTVRGVAPNVAMTPWPQPAPVSVTDPTYPQLDEVVLGAAQSLGSNVRWFEQAFEWENMAYVSYPYFWGRRATWMERSDISSSDPLFLEFLQAGYARVVVPVRLGFEHAVCFYLHTGLPWLGQQLPPIGDRTQNPLYLDVAEEIKALTGGGEPGEADTPIGDPWEYVLPTTLMKLRDDDDLPAWRRIGPDGTESPAYPSDAPPDAWTWEDGAPGI